MKPISTDIRYYIRNMAVGEQLDFSAEKVTYVRNALSVIGLQENRHYKSKSNRERQIVTVTRIS